MSATESSPATSGLQESIEQLIAETVRRSQSEHEEETQRLRDALRTALSDIEAGHASLTRAAETLRVVLGDAPALEPVAESSEDIEPETPAPVDVVPVEPIATTEAEVGPHELDVIAHDVTIGIATSLQSLLRGRPEVNSAQTREFVNGELRLKLEMKSSLNMTVVNEWIANHGGRVNTSTASVLELRFGA